MCKLQQRHKNTKKNKEEEEEKQMKQMKKQGKGAAQRGAPAGPRKRLRNHEILSKTTFTASRVPGSRKVDVRPALLFFVRFPAPPAPPPMPAAVRDAGRNPTNPGGANRSAADSPARLGKPSAALPEPSVSPLITDRSFCPARSGSRGQPRPPSAQPPFGRGHERQRGAQRSRPHRPHRDGRAALRQRHRRAGIPRCGPDAGLRPRRGEAEEAERAEKVSLKQNGAATPRPDGGPRNKTRNTAAAPGEAPRAAPGAPRPPPAPRPAPYLRPAASRCSAASPTARPPPARSASGRAGTARTLRAAARGPRVSGRAPARPRPRRPGPGLPCRTCRWLMAETARPRRAALCTRRPGNRAGGSGAGGGA